ncbi:carboxymuconolactone decarboxylase family protein [Streptomyces sp. NPDC003401]
MLPRASTRSCSPLVHLRVSQINGCSACLYASISGGKKVGDSDERPHHVAAWCEAPFHTDAERAALAPAEAATRLQDGAPGVTDEIREQGLRPFRAPDAAGDDEEEG